MSRPSRRPLGSLSGAEEEALFKAYRISSSDPDEWEDVDPSDETAGAGGPGGKAARGEEDPLGLLKGGVMNPEWPAELRLAVATTSKTFDPKTFLSTVHPNASFSDLKVGGERLKDSLEQRSEALKVLVEQEFDRFVGVKAATEAVFEEMRIGPLQPEADYSTAELREALRLATSKADQVYAPLLDNRRKAERLRSTLGVFERSKFFFNLPGTLMEAIEAGRYDTALLAYKRGRHTVDSRPGQVLGLPAPSNASEAEQHRRIFEKVWNQVEKTIGELRQVLEGRLRETKRGLDEVEKTIEILLELDPAEDPVWIFLETQHRHIQQRLRTACDEAAAKCRAHRAGEAGPLDERRLARDISICVACLSNPTDFETTVERLAEGSDAWRSLSGVVKAVADVLAGSLPAFWKVAKAYLDGKYHKTTPSGGSRRPPQLCRQMTHEIVVCFTDLLSSFFVLPPPSNPTQPSADDSLNLPSYAPVVSNALTAAHFLNRTLLDLIECANDVGSLDLPAESATALQGLMARMRVKFEGILCAYWVRDAKCFYFIEAWRPNPSDPATTLYLGQIRAFHSACAQNALRLAGGSDEAVAAAFQADGTLKGASSASGSVSRLPRSEALPVECVRKIQSAFLDALYAFLDGLVHVAFAPPALASSSNGSETVAREQVTARTRSGSTVAGTALRTGTGTEVETKEVDADNVDTRILLTVSNLAHLNTMLIPRMMNQFSEVFKVDVTQDTATLKDVIGQLDKILFDDYIKRKASALGRIIHEGVLGGKIDWFTAPKPTEVHPFIYDALLALVLVHAHTSSLAGPAPPGSTPATSLVHRVLASLIRELAGQCLQAFGAVKRFGMGGMLQATLEIEFMHQTLSPYVTPEADATMQEIYRKISSAYERSASTDGSSDLQNELETLKRTLQMSRRSTALTFLCFRRPKADPPPDTKSA